MTVSSTTTKASYSGNGSTTVFAVPFYFLQNADLLVILRSSAGVETTQVLGTNYTLTGAGNEAGGSLTMTVAPPTGTTLTILRNAAATQETDLLPNDRLPAESLETALDKLTMLVQQLDEESARSIKFAMTDASTSSTLPTSSQRANKFLSFDNSGNPIVTGSTDTYTVSEEVKIATQGQTVFTLATMSYIPGINNLSVFVDGVNQYRGTAYTETNSTTVTFSQGLHAGAVVKFSTVRTLSSDDPGANNVMFLQAGAGAVVRSVQSKERDIVSVEDFGAVGDGVTDDTAAIQAAINALSSGKTLVFDGNYKITNQLLITNKSRIRLTGKGRVFFDGAPSGAYMFLLVGTIDDLEIDHLTLVGDNNAGYSQGAIGCNSGQIISNTRFHDLNIYNINVGISHNADLGGSWTNGLCYNNYFENIKGTVAGSGYGIQAARAYNLHIYGNTINNASRHSIYVGKGQNLACVISNNVIINHRKDVADGSIRAAIDCGRVSGVTISGNTFRDCYDGQIYLGADTGLAQNSSDILIIGNKFGTPKNTVPCIWIGEQLTPTTFFLSRVDVLDNTFEQDCSITAASIIYILHGSQITIKNNRLRAYSVAATLPIFAEIGDTSYISSDSHINDITVCDNVATSDKGSTVSGSRLLYIVDQLCTGASHYTAKNNSCPTWANEYYFQTNPVNLNSKLKFTSTVTHTWSVGANSIVSAALTVVGCKPSSSVTVRPNSAAIVSPYVAIGGYASNAGVNVVELYAINTSGGTSTQTNLAHLIHIEDF